MQCKRCQTDGEGFFCTECGESLRPFDNFPIYVGRDLINLCNAWHRGQGTAMYSVLSTGSIHSRDIAESLSCELSQCSRLAAERIPENLTDLDAMEEQIAWLDRILS